MAPDQRYCLECGERRSGGGLREALPRAPATAAATPAKARRAFLSSSSTSLIAGVATLLLAMGVGVLIGRTADKAPARSNAPVQVVTVPNGSGAAAAGTAGAAGTTAAANTATKVKKHKAAKKAASKSKARTELEKTAAKSGVKLPPPVVKIGQKCEKGAAGCQGGKFTGNFFGGGG